MNREKEKKHTRIQNQPNGKMLPSFHLTNEGARKRLEWAGEAANEMERQDEGEEGEWGKKWFFIRRSK